MQSDLKRNMVRKRVSFKLEPSISGASKSTRLKEKLPRHTAVSAEVDEGGVSKCSPCVVLAWCSLTLTLACIALLIFTSLTVLYEYSAPQELREMMRQCKANVTLCTDRPTLHYDAVSQLVSQNLSCPILHDF